MNNDKLSSEIHIELTTNPPIQTMNDVHKEIPNVPNITNIQNNIPLSNNIGVCCFNIGLCMEVNNCDICNLCNVCCKYMEMCCKCCFCCLLFK